MKPVTDCRVTDEPQSPDRRWDFGRCYAFHGRTYFAHLQCSAVNRPKSVKVRRVTELGCDPPLDPRRISQKNTDLLKISTCR
jgi:hypothetical protein